MTTQRDRRPVDLRPISLSLVSTYPPTRCGVGRFSHSLGEAWKKVAPDANIRIARISTRADGVPPDATVDMIFDPSSPVARRSAARSVSHSDAVVLQHEYGLYGPEDGIAVIDLARRIEAPLVSMIHTVRPEPSPRQREIIEALGDLGTMVVLSEVARSQLLSSHDVDPAGVFVIPHGSSWSPGPAPGPKSRRKLITWGLLGPGKGIERALRAMARVDLEPAVTYDIVGQTHPNVLARYGLEYRDHLEKLSRDLDLEDVVRFVDRYVSDEELELMVREADVVVVPYDNTEQVCSGVLTDAVAIGKPVVATDFPHARELVSDRCGRTTGHDSNAIADAIEELLTDDAAYATAAAGAAAVSPSLSWTGVAAAHLDLVHQLRSDVVVA